MVIDMINNKQLPFCPKINDICKGENCICYQLKENAKVTAPRKGEPELVKEFECILFKRSFSEWAFGRAVNK